MYLCFLFFLNFNFTSVSKLVLAFHVFFIWLFFHCKINFLRKKTTLFRYEIRGLIPGSWIDTAKIPNPGIVNFAPGLDALVTFEKKSGDEDLCNAQLGGTSVPCSLYNLKANLTNQYTREA